MNLVNKCLVSWSRSHIFIGIIATKFKFHYDYKIVELQDIVKVIVLLRSIDVMYIYKYFMMSL